MKLEIKKTVEKFKIEVPQEDGTFKEILGTIRDFTKDEQETYEAKFNPLLKQLATLREISANKDYLLLKKDVLIKEDKKREAYDTLTEIKQLDEKMKENDFDFGALDRDMIKDKFELTLDLECRNEVLELCEEHGYSVVLTCINKDIAEGKQNGLATS